MNLPVVLDADGLDALASAHPPERLRAILAEALERRRDVVVPAVVCAEVCRGVGRTRAVESALSPSRRDGVQRSPVRVVDTDFDLARSVGAVLHAAGSGRRDVVDAHVVAVAAAFGGGLVVTADPEDIGRLAQAVPSARILTRPAR